MKIRVDKSLTLAIISIAIPIVLVILTLNINAKFIPGVKVPMDLYIYPLYLCPIAMILSIISLKINKNKVAFISLVINVCLILFEILFLLVGCRFLSH